MYSENLFIKIEEYNEKFNDSFPLMLIPDVEEKIIIEKINECLATDKNIYSIVDWFDIFEDNNIDG